MRETQTKETKRKRGNAVETEKGNGENREQEEEWVEGGGGGGATRDYLRKKEARKKEGDFVHVSTTQAEEKRK